MLTNMNDFIDLAIIEPSPAVNSPETNNNNPLPNENSTNTPETPTNNDVKSTTDDIVENKSPSIENARSQSSSPHETRPTSPESTETIEIVDIEAGRSEIAKVSKAEKILGVTSKEAFAETKIVNEERDDIDAVETPDEKSVDRIVLMGTEIVAENLEMRLDASAPKLADFQ